MTSPAPHGRRTSGDAPNDHGPFLPGQVIGDRYRMVGLLGRGGMGEVYRADDLKLGQPVALKFLPHDVDGDHGRLDRFLTEVRLSLRVTHPNICRVFDVGQVGGRHFISMEYVDGEDLSSLLRRIGRLPEDKAVEISRQLCAGLAAAHDEGVLHRDLKPANVMIDGRGRAKITDFGLAGATSGIAGAEARAGTPQYMAPEQIAGRELTPQTDVYSLGLVLYEIFTGKRAFDSRDLLELAALHATTPTNPSAHVPGLNPIVERAILRAVDPDPARRPRSAAAFAALLPGGDPLAMAIAAGETPSPEMVARSGGRGELGPAVAVLCLATVIAGMIGMWMWEGRTALQNLVPLAKPPEELRASARSVLAAAGVTGKTASSAYGFTDDGDYFHAFDDDKRPASALKTLSSSIPMPVSFWYRESPVAMKPLTAYRLDVDNPPMTRPGMTRVSIDPVGRLIELVVVPDDHVTPATARTEPNWDPLFAAAGFAPDEWLPAQPVWTPPVASDARRAWSRGALRIEAASFEGNAVWFAVVPPWRRTAAARATTEFDTVAWVPLTIVIVLVVAGVALARRNIRLGRTDRRGALRFAAAYLAVGAIIEVLRMTGPPMAWFEIFSRNFSRQLLTAVIAWLFYVAIEPHVRRLWPRTLVAWNRVLDGQFHDPMVGRHILLGALGGLVMSVVFELPLIQSFLFGTPAPEPVSNVGTLVFARFRAAALLNDLQSSIMLPVGFLLLLLVLRVLCRRPWIANVVLIGVAAGWAALIPDSWVDRAVFVLVIVTLATVLTRLGLLAMCVVIFFSSWQDLNLTTDPSAWFFPGSVLTMAVFAAIAVYAFVVSLGGQRIFKSSVLDAT